MRKIIRYIKNWFKNRQNKKNMKKRMKDILKLYGEKIADMLIKLKYETNKDWINELK